MLDENIKSKMDVLLSNITDLQTQIEDHEAKLFTLMNENTVEDCPLKQYETIECLV